MTRRTITARHVAACVETLVLIGCAAACGASSHTAASVPPAGSANPDAVGPATSTGSASVGIPNTPTAASGTAERVDPAPPQPSASPASPRLTIHGDTVTPATLTVHPGESVAIANSDAVAHDLVDSQDKLSSEVIKAESDGALTAPSTVGKFRMTDPNHPGTHVTLVVK